MSDEPRDGRPDGTADPSVPAGDPVSSTGREDGPSGTASPASDPQATGTLGTDPPLEDTRTDGSRTEVSAPWERPRRWQRSSVNAHRIDALLARLSTADGDDPDNEPDTRRSRRGNNDAEAVPASALIAALGDAENGDAAPGPGVESAMVAAAPMAGNDITPVAATGELPTPGREQKQTDQAKSDAPASEQPESDAPESEQRESEQRGSDAPVSEQQESDEAQSEVAPDAPAAATAGAAAGTAPDRTDADGVEPIPEDDRSDEAHTDTLPRSSDNAPDLAEAGSIRAALDRQAASSQRTAAAPGGAAPGGTASVPRSSAGRRKAAGAATASGGAGTTLIHGSSRRRHRGWLYAGRTVAALVALITLLGVGVEWKIKDRAEVVIQSNAVPDALNTTDPSISTARTMAVVTTNSRGVTTTESAKPKTVYQPENILLLGSDTRSGSNAAIGGSDSSTDGTANSDTLMVAHISGDREHVTVLSIPRDTLIPAPHCKVWNSSTGKLTTEDNSPPPGQIYHINSAYSVGGPTCTVTAVQSLTGLGITRMIGIDFEGFKAMVDALGGITVNVCRPIQDAVLGTVVAKGGVQVIKGAQAISLVRARDVIGDTQSDLARIHRQQVVLSAILRQVTQAGTLLNPGKLDGFLQAFSKNTFTQNVKLEDLVMLAGSLGTLDPAHVTFYTLPTVPSTEIDGALDVDKAKAAPVFDDLINDLPLPGETPTPAKPKPTAAATSPAASSLKLTVAPSDIAVELYNVSGRDNVAGMAQQELNAAGFSIDDNQLFKPGRTQTATVVQFDPTNRAAALTVAAAVPGSTLFVIPGLGKTVHVQLGSNFAGVIKTVAIGQQAPASLSTAVSTGASVAPSKTTSATASTALSSVNAAAGTCA